VNDMGGDLSNLGILIALFAFVVFVYWAATYRSPRANLTIKQIRAGIARLQKRVEDLEAFKPSFPSKSELKAREIAIDNALTDVFGTETTEYKQYQSAGRLRPSFLARIFSDRLMKDEYVDKNRQRAIVLLRMAIRELQERIPNLASEALLPKETLHQRLSGPVWAAYMRGEFDSAAFQAMKAVEVSVREAANLSAADLGVNLMRKAFNPENGLLTDPKAEGGEREARMNLFAGAIGSYKNPHSHRDVNLDDPDEVAEIIMLANNLLRVVDARAADKAKPNP
jgi:uncharacterized protein (TIGR02391 family)